MTAYAFTDIHGSYSLWKKIQKFCKEDDIIYCLGDFIDRGPGGPAIFEEMLEDPRVIILKGNHEDMFVDSVYYNSEDLPFYMEHYGHQAVNYFANLSLDEQKNFISKLENLPVEVGYTRPDKKIVFMTHSGATSLTMKWINNHTRLWNRTHMDTQTYWNENKNFYIVHGHTPVQCYNKDEPMFYCDNHKIDLDLATYETGKIALLNLDTFEYQIFKK